MREARDWPRIRDLPEVERQPFLDFLVGQTIPTIIEEGVPAGTQDAYYPWDYDNWKRKPNQRFFD